FLLGVEHAGGKLGGLPTDVVKEDDQLKPDVGLQVAKKLLERDRVDFVVGTIFSNVMMAIYKPVVDTRTFLISHNAGPSPIAGKLCSPFFFSSARCTRRSISPTTPPSWPSCGRPSPTPPTSSIRAAWAFSS